MSYPPRRVSVHHGERRPTDARDQRQHRITRRSLVPLRRITWSVLRCANGSGKARVHDELGFWERDRKPVCTAEALGEAQHSYGAGVRAPERLVLVLLTRGEVSRRSFERIMKNSSCSPNP